MYARYYGLNRMPFEASPDPGFLFEGPVHREAIASIEYAMSTRMGFITLIGEVGLGKTTIIRAFLNSYDRGRLLPIYVFHPLLSFDELLQLLAEELGLELAEGTTSFNRLRAIQRELIQLYSDKRQVVLVIDEAQRLPEDTLENLRLLTNLETDDAKLLQIVLVGQPELEGILAQPHLRQLDQRIVLKARLDVLAPADGVRYLRHRLSLAGAADPEDVFTPAAMTAIVELSEGVPRRMNILANRTLIDGFGADERPVSADRVRRVAGNGAAKPASRRGERRRLRWVWPFAALVVLATGAGAAKIYRPDLAAAGVDRVRTTWASFDWRNETRSLFGTAGGSKAPAAASTPASQGPVQTAAASPPAPTTIAAGAASAPVSPAPASPVPANPASAQATTRNGTPTASAVSQAGVPAAPPASSAAPAPSQSGQPASAPIPAVRPATVPVAQVAVATPATLTVPAPNPQPANPQPALAPPAPEAPPAEIPLSPDRSSHEQSYTVVPGDTLWKICLRAYGPDTAPTMIAPVMSRNKIASDVRLLWGKTIVLPPAKAG